MEGTSSRERTTVHSAWQEGELFQCVESHNPAPDDRVPDFCSICGWNARRMLQKSGTRCVWGGRLRCSWGRRDSYAWACRDRQRTRVGLVSHPCAGIPPLLGWDVFIRMGCGPSDRAGGRKWGVRGLPGQNARPRPGRGRDPWRGAAAHRRPRVSVRARGARRRRNAAPRPPQRRYARRSPSLWEPRVSAAAPPPVPGQPQPPPGARGL